MLSQMSWKYSSGTRPVNAKATSADRYSDILSQYDANSYRVKCQSQRVKNEASQRKRTISNNTSISHLNTQVLCPHTHIDPISQTHNAHINQLHWSSRARPA